MKAVEMNEIVGSFISGLGEPNNIDINNALFIAKELFHLYLPITYKGAGRNGVKSLELYLILRNIKPSQKNEEALSIGNTLAQYSSRELMLMASYLWNKGKSSLNSKEREKASILLEEEFSHLKSNHDTRSSAAGSI
jgi:hypothetical protein